MNETVERNMEYQSAKESPLTLQRLLVHDGKVYVGLFPALGPMYSEYI